jgi:hypothetical protein
MQNVLVCFEKYSRIFVQPLATICRYRSFPLLYVYLKHAEKLLCQHTLDRRLFDGLNSDMYVKIWYCRIALPPTEKVGVLKIIVDDNIGFLDLTLCCLLYVSFKLFADLT